MTLISLKLKIQSTLNVQHGEFASENESELFYRMVP